MFKVMVKHADLKIFSYGIITPYAKQKTEIEKSIDSLKGQSTIVLAS